MSEDAGSLAPWLRDMQAALEGERDADVPCGTCTACCTGSQFVHVEADEHDAIAHIPKELLFPAPRSGGGFVLGYDERGHCPMLRDGACSIYAHRPRTCRVYDCRVFAATGIEVDGEARSLIRERVERWRFTEVSSDDRAARAALDAAVAELRDDPLQRPPGVPADSPLVAILAVRAAQVEPPRRRGDRDSS